MGSFIKTIGILGGAGPWASAYAHTELVRRAQTIYGAVQDQEYPEIIHWSVRFDGFGAKGIEEREIMLEQLCRVFDRFRQGGARVALIACNSLHIYFNELHTCYPEITIAHLPRAGACALAKAGIQKAGILCSESALADGLHKGALEEYGIEAVLPDRGQQDRINVLIEQVMGGAETEDMKEEVRKLSRGFAVAGADVMLSGCTEISWLATKVSEVKTVDCLGAAVDDVLAMARLETV